MTCRILLPVTIKEYMKSGKKNTKVWELNLQG